MSAQVRDMTKGSPAKLILLFAVPLMLGNIFQQLYTICLLYTSPSPRDLSTSRMPSSA